MDDSILYWNEVALEANRVSHTTGRDSGTLGPPLSTRALAIVHLAMYDAYAGATNRPNYLPPYLPGLPALNGGASADAAVAAAAHLTLSALFPSQRALFDQKLAAAGLGGPGFEAGRDFGLLVGERMLEDRLNDPGANEFGYTPSTERGAHRPDPDNPGQGYHAPFYGARSKLFAATDRFELMGPPSLGSPEYLAALAQVRGKGIAPELMGTLPSSAVPRTPAETLIGIFWGYDGAAGLGTPPRLYNQIIRTLAIARSNTTAENARLFALVNVAMADAGILCWDQKYIHNFWRPVLGIREHDRSMGLTGQGNNNLAHEGDPFWLPLGAPSTNVPAKNFTPPFPAYPSGHATFGAAALHMTRLFYGVRNHGPDQLFDGLTFVSDELNGVNQDNKGAVRPRHVRSFPDGLWQMIEENGLSRVYLGVHWVFDAFALNGSHPDLDLNVGGVPLGLRVAEDIFDNGGGKAPRKSTVGPRS